MAFPALFRFFFPPHRHVSTLHLVVAPLPPCFGGSGHRCGISCPHSSFFFLLLFSRSPSSSSRNVLRLHPPLLGYACTRTAAVDGFHADLFGGFPGAPSILDVTSAPPAAAAAAAVAPFVPAPPIPTSAPAPGGGGSSSALLNAARGQAQANRQLQEARAQHAFESRKKLEEEAARSIAAAAPAQAPPSAADALAEEAARARAAAREAREKQALARDLPDNDFAGGWS